MKRFLPAALTLVFGLLISNASAAANVQADIESQGLFLTFISIFVGGMLVSLTPCVYPMIPITLSIIGARSAESKPVVGFLRSFVFVLGIATIYTVLGLVVALSGGTIGFLLQSKGFLIALSVLFIIMGLSMLGMFNLQLPPAIAAKFQGGGNRGGFLGAFILGITTGVVASPCGSPVLVGILALAGAGAQPVLGALMLFTYALGIGMLFLVLGTFPAFLSKVPKSGVWMEDVKKMLGLVLIIAAFYYLSLALPKMLVWGMLIATCLMFAGMIAIKSGERAQWPKLLWAWRFVGLILVAIAVYASLVAVPALLAKDKDMNSDSDVDLATLSRISSASKQAKDGTTSGTSVLDAPPSQWVKDEASAVALAKEHGWPVVIDFGAEWCAACKELEEKTFPKPDVVEALSGFMKVHIDCTDGDEKSTELQKKYNSVSLPTVIFINANGEVMPELTLENFEEPAEFIERLKKVEAAQ